MDSIYSSIVQELHVSRGNPRKVRVLSSFFKTGRGQYGEGDTFLGVTVPDQRKIAKKYYREVAFSDIAKLLKSPIHEYRLTGLFLLVYRFEKAQEKDRKNIYEFYIRNIASVNSWDLVDSTTPNIIGEYLYTHPKEIKRLAVWAKSNNLWERRIAILATYTFIKKGDFSQTLRIAEILMSDEHDLIHKAVGWMLREVGKRDEKVLIDFLDAYEDCMPRIMLRYAIERLTVKQKQFYMYKKSI
jgi:3-methyladenine DNA glycosylase AlkD